MVSKARTDFFKQSLSYILSQRDGFLCTSISGSSPVVQVAGRCTCSPHRRQIAKIVLIGPQFKRIDFGRKYRSQSYSNINDIQGMWISLSLIVEVWPGLRLYRGSLRCIWEGGCTRIAGTGSITLYREGRVTLYAWEGFTSYRGFTLYKGLYFVQGALLCSRGFTLYFSLFGELFCVLDFVCRL